jgi:nitrite reductase/ring-hydroxylating ferredoxin subunit
MSLEWFLSARWFSGFAHRAVHDRYDDAPHDDGLHEFARHDFKSHRDIQHKFEPDDHFREVPLMAEQSGQSNPEARCDDDARRKAVQDRAVQNIAAVAGDSRRGFLVRAAAIVIGAIVTLVPLGAGLAVFCDPLFRKRGSAQLVRIATLDQVDDDGIPRPYPVVATRVDAWNRYPPLPVGLVFLRREPGTDQVSALNAKCPHAGCFVDFNDSDDKYFCPCHRSAFTIAGVRIPPSPSPEDLFRVEVDQDMLAKGEVWINLATA